VPVRRCRAPRRRLIGPRRRAHRRVARCRAVPVPHRSGAIVRVLAPDASTCRHRHLALPARLGQSPGAGTLLPVASQMCPPVACDAAPAAAGARRCRINRCAAPRCGDSATPWPVSRTRQPHRAPCRCRAPWERAAMPPAAVAWPLPPTRCMPHDLPAGRGRKPSCIASPLDKLVMMRTVAVTLPGRNRQPRILRVTTPRTMRRSDT
jgi:hypothetical protein